MEFTLDSTVTGKRELRPNETPKSTHTSRFSGSRNKAKYASKVKCFTLQPVQDGSDVGSSRVMLGLKDEKDNSSCDYEPRAVVTKPKAKKEDIGNLLLGTRKKVLPQNYVSMHELTPSGRDENVQGGDLHRNLSLEEGIVQNEKQIQEKIDRENSVTFYNSSEQNENSKAFIESLGSWINDLFNVPSKTPCVSSEALKNDYNSDSVLEEDPDYLKSISAIKEQFRKKLKSETSIQVSVPDTPFIFNFDKGFETEKKGAKSLPESKPADWLEELEDFGEQIAETNPATAGLVIRTSEIENRPCKSKTNLHLKGSILIKKRKMKVKNRHDISELEEYIFPTPSELSKRILLNVSDDEKCGQLYKNYQSLGVQEAQHYGQRKSKTKTNARCYTTNANHADTPTNSKKAGKSFSHYCTTSATTVRSNDEILRRNPMEIKRYQSRKPSKKEVSDITRDSMTFLRMNSKSTSSVPMERSDPKTSSDDLVKYLMKKIKNTRPQQSRPKTSSVNVPQLLGNPKNRFMQSATNTLVSVMAKKDIENQASMKNITRSFPDTRINTSKELILKNSDNIRLDVSRAIAANKYSRLSYLLEDNKIEDDGYLFEKNYRSSKRNTDETQKQGQKRNSNKLQRRQEVKNMFSKIDSRYGLFESAKEKKERKKKVVEIPENNYLKEEQNARFQKQHELFKTNFKMMQQNESVAAESEEVKNEVKEDSQNVVPLSTELAVVDKNVQEINLADLQDITDQSNTILGEKVFSEVPIESDFQGYELQEDDNIKSEKRVAENTVLYKDKVFKPKPLQFFKDTDSKMMLSPLEKLYITEQTPKDSSKVHESPLCPPDVGQVKAMDTFLLNRRYSTNTLNESSPRTKSIPWISPVKNTLFLDDLERDTNGDKKDTKDKKKLKSPKTMGNKETLKDSCGFDKAKKKPGPNCEKEE